MSSLTAPATRAAARFFGYHSGPGSGAQGTLISLTNGSVHRGFYSKPKESRGEVYRRFPATLDGVGPPLSHRYDLIYIQSQSDFNSDTFPKGSRLEFLGDWNKLVHRLALNSHAFEFWLECLRMPANTVPQYFDMTLINRFMDFLTTFTNLKQLALTKPDMVWGGSNTRAIIYPQDADILSEILPGCLGMVMHCLEKARSGLKGLIFDDQNSAFHREWKGVVKTGYPMLRNLEISKMAQFSERHWQLCSIGIIPPEEPRLESDLGQSGSNIS